jgi:hypothetical protein
MALASFPSFGSATMLPFPKHSHPDLVVPRDLLEVGKITPVIDRPSRSARPDAIRYVKRRPRQVVSQSPTRFGGTDRGWRPAEVNPRHATPRRPAGDRYGTLDVVELRDVERRSRSTTRSSCASAASVSQADLDSLGPKPGCPAVHGLRAPRLARSASTSRRRRRIARRDHVHAGRPGLRRSVLVHGSFASTWRPAKRHSRRSRPACRSRTRRRCRTRPCSRSRASGFEADDPTRREGLIDSAPGNVGRSQSESRSRWAPR